MRRETSKTDANSVHFSGQRRGWLEVDVRMKCAKCGNRKLIEKGCKRKPAFICAECNR